MENTLNTNDGWEAVVNNPDRQERIDRFHARRMKNKMDKLAMKTFIFGFIAVSFGVLAFTGAMTPWIGAPIAIAFLALFFFNCGRYSELRRG